MNESLSRFGVRIFDLWQPSPFNVSSNAGPVERPVGRALLLIPLSVLEQTKFSITGINVAVVATTSIRQNGVLMLQLLRLDHVVAAFGDGSSGRYYRLGLN